MNGRRPSVANALRHEQAEAEFAMSPAERVRRAQDMFEEGLAIFMHAQKLSRQEALARLAASSQNGRRFSRCMMP